MIKLTVKPAPTEAEEEEEIQFSLRPKDGKVELVAQLGTERITSRVMVFTVANGKILFTRFRVPSKYFHITGKSWGYLATHAERGQDSNEERDVCLAKS